MSSSPAAVAPGAFDPLSQGEGFLVLQVDSDVAVEHIRMDDRIVARDLQPGQHLWLIRTKAGRLRWTAVKLQPQLQAVSSIRPEAEGVLNEREFEFEVKAGAVNYPGEIVIRMDAPEHGIGSGVTVRNRNHSAMAIRKLSKSHFSLLAAHPIRYAGSTGDEFLQFYTRERDRLAGASKGQAVQENEGYDRRPQTPPRDGSLLFASATAWAGESAESIFPGAGVTEVLVSPLGDWIAATAHRGDDALVLVQRVGLPELAVVARSERIGQVAWEASNTLVIEFIPATGIAQVLVVGLSVEDGKIAVHERKIGARGWLVDSLPMIPEKVLWAIPGKDSTSLHRISFAELIDYNRLYRSVGGTIGIAEKMAVVQGHGSHWVAQRDGTPRAALRYTENETILMMPSRVTGSFRSVYRYAHDDPEHEVQPVGLTPDESRVLVLAYNGKDTLGLYEWDERAGAAGNPVFVHPEFDLTGVLTDRLTGDLVAAVYEEDGEPRYQYFEAYRDRFLSKLPDPWRKDSIAVVSGTADRRVFAFLDSSATNPGEFHLRDRAGHVQRIAVYGENVDREKLSPVGRFRVRSKDGAEIEAFLALPRDSAGGAPLVVMPHGGPHSVRDSRRYDPVVQYLASWGFAVLQVNYRGSSGYGRDFEGLGKKQWARGIEDDIDAAVEHAMGLPEIDGNRICIVGGSYGGFSAFASVVRHRDRYRCAVSINGASDIPLLYDSSDMADSKQAMAFYKEHVGDLETERAKLIEISPAYHVRELVTPTLVIHGTDDRRVDPDHSHRMVMMFELYGRAFETLEIEGAEHGFERDEWIIVARALRRFVTAHLTPAVPFRPDP